MSRAVRPLEDRRSRPQLEDVQLFDGAHARGFDQRLGAAEPLSIAELPS